MSTNQLAADEIPDAYLTYQYFTVQFFVFVIIVIADGGSQQSAFVEDPRYSHYMGTRADGFSAASPAAEMPAPNPFSAASYDDMISSGNCKAS